MPYSKEDLKRMAGAGNMERAPRLVLNEVSVNGNTGEFRKRVNVGHTDRNVRAEEVELGKRVSVIFLNVRRQLVQRDKKGVKQRQTSEHNRPESIVSVWPEKIYGKAQAIREMFDGLRTVQVVYALLLDSKAGTKEPELVRLIVKGSSLGSENKAKTTVAFYDYLGSFKNGDEFFEFQTVLTPVEETGAREYFCMTFERGPKISDAGMEQVGQQIAEVAAFIEKHDAYVKQRAEEAGVSQTTIVKDQSAAPDGVDSPSPDDGKIQYPDEDINPEDIPF